MSDVITISLPDGSEREYPAGTTAADVASSIGKRLAKAAVAATVDGAEVDLGRPLGDHDHVAIITTDSEAGRHVLRHSTAHVMAQAVTDLFPGAKFSIGPAIENGFYYDFDLPGGRTFSDDDLATIEARMREIIAADQPFVRSELSADDALVVFADQPYKVEIIERVRALDDDDGADALDTGEVAGRRHDQHLPQHARVRRSVPWPPCAFHGAPRSFQTAEGRRRLLAGQPWPRGARCPVATRGPSCAHRSFAAGCLPPSRARGPSLPALARPAWPRARRAARAASGRHPISCTGGRRCRPSL